MTTFQDFDLPEQLRLSLTKIGFDTPTPIQAQTIPLALAGRDILGTAQTGTGKTGAFAVPMVAKMMNDPKASVIILTPTRELATQIIKMFGQLIASDRSIKSALLIGGESISRQFLQLKTHPRLIVGTPGRINDHIDRGTLRLDRTHNVILDETDRMLDMGFGIQIESIMAELPEERQTLMFSATMPKNIEKISGQYLRNPERVKIEHTVDEQVKIEQETINLAERDKFPELLRQINKHEGSVIVFVKTKRSADELTERLNEENQQTDTVHGDLRQKNRERVIKSFRSERFRILVATDIAARGLDIPHIRLVINYDLPQCAEDYVHRIGRTGRAGASGTAVSFVSPRDRGAWSAINRLINPNAANDSYRDEPRARSNGNRSGGFGDKRPAFGRRRDDNGRSRDGERSFAPRPPRAEGERSFAPRPPRAEGERSFAPRPPRAEGERNFAPRPPRAEGERSFAPRPPRAEGERNFAPRSPRAEGERGFAPRPPRAEGESRGYSRDSGSRGGYSNANAGGSSPRGEFRSPPRRRDVA